MKRPVPISASLRLAESRDAGALSALSTQVYLDTYAPNGINNVIAREVFDLFEERMVLAEINAPRSRFLIAENEGYVVGYCSLVLGASIERLGSQGQSEVTRLYVQRPFLGQGVGHALLVHAGSIAKSENSDVVWLRCWSENRRALDFYARQRYVDAGPIDYMINGQSYENRVLYKSLASPLTPLR